MKTHRMFKYGLITAAGHGSRLDPLTQYLPKALVEVNGAPMIRSLLDQINPLVPHVSVTIGYKAEMLASRLAQSISAMYNTSGKGNGWWIFNTPLRFVNAPVLVVACDIVADLDLHFIYDQYLKNGHPPCMLVPIHATSDVEGDFIEYKDGRVTALSRTIETPMMGSGIYVINPAVVNARMAEMQDVTDVWKHFLPAGDLGCTPIYPKFWATVNNLEQLYRCQQALTVNL
ncbi:nucleotidyltransferase family protein [Chitinophaga caseinilytica]|uniref:NTP transferase domain-containing protein n=1 Tax=Chitinophaga caseinilytica TaxID=2267521 RepID=A0ABZ2Z4Q2_9BACT